MNLLVLCGVLVSTLASLLVGSRLLLLAARTRALPELTMGIALALSGGLGVLMTFFARVYGAALGDAAGWLLGVAQICVLAGPVSVGLFSWRVFRPGTSWAPYAFGAGAGVLFAVWLANCATVGFREFPLSGAPFWAGYSIRISAYAWSTLEAGLYWSKLRRRARLGLADPVVSNRILLWTITMATAVFMHLPTLLQRAGVTSEATGRLLLSAGGMVTAVGLWLAFFPPRAYLRRIAAAG
jgi:hypothetical protein